MGNCSEIWREPVALTKSSHRSFVGFSFFMWCWLHNQTTLYWIYYSFTFTYPSLLPLFFEITIEITTEQWTFHNAKCMLGPKCVKCSVLGLARSQRVQGCVVIYIPPGEHISIITTYREKRSHCSSKPPRHVRTHGQSAASSPMSGRKHRTDLNLDLFL